MEQVDIMLLEDLESLGKSSNSLVQRKDDADRSLVIHLLWLKVVKCQINIIFLPDHYILELIMQFFMCLGAKSVVINQEHFIILSLTTDLGVG